MNTFIEMYWDVKKSTQRNQFEISFKGDYATKVNLQYLNNYTGIFL